MELSPRLLESDWVRLEPLEEDHRERLRPIAADRQIWTHMSERGDGAHFDAWFDRRLAEQEAGQLIGHLVIDKASCAPAGHSSFLAISAAHRRLEIGWTFYAAPYRGTKVNPAAKLLLMSRAIEAGAERIELKTSGQNFRSQRAMAKLGLTREGMLRSHIITWTGRRRDSVYYSMLREEWPGIRVRLEERLRSAS